ncbi:OmpA family protein [Desulfurivibrio alkaliphilus]|uniref:OmpA family protein n=1 Tax=Desulfurivibrio alkaliphilus TaxID=427923 RepID=UPI0012FE9635|nr:OmpA family protein [Desulfurivibrio alkaliphilus]
MIRPFPGAVLHERSSVYQNFDSYEFQVRNPQTGRAERQMVKGEYRRLRYFLHKEDGSRDTSVSRVEYFENFKSAALAMGGEIKWEDSRELVFTIPREDGGVTWCRVEVSVGAGSTILIIIDEEPLEIKLEFGPDQMKAALDADGRIALYGILFDYDRATLQQASSKQLQGIVTLLHDHPDLRLEIQGHTDSDGSAAYNLQLSQRRAESVLNYLLLFGIDPSRLKSKGYGETMPVAPNDTAENKAKNRRVELVRLD